MPLWSQSASSQKTLRWSECEESIPRATFETSSNHSYIVKKCQESRIQEWVRASVGSLGRQVQPIDSLFGRWETSTSELSQRLGLGWEGGTIPRGSPGILRCHREFLTSSASSTAPTRPWTRCCFKVWLWDGARSGDLGRCMPHAITWYNVQQEMCNTTSNIQRP